MQLRDANTLLADLRRTRPNLGVLADAWIEGRIRRFSRQFEFQLDPMAARRVREACQTLKRRKR